MTLINRLMAIALALASAATLAASPSADDAWEQLTRAQVKAELAAARASGTLVPASVSTASRAEIRGIGTEEVSGCEPHALDHAER